MFLALMLGLGFLSSCLKVETINTDKWQPNLAIPLINSELRIEDFIYNSVANDSVRANEENLLVLVYEKSSGALHPEELTDIESFTLAIPDTVVGIPITMLPFDFDYNRVDIKNGLIQFEFIVDTQEDIEVSINLFNLVKDSVTFFQRIPIQYTGQSPSMKTGTRTIDGFSIDFSGHFIVQYDARTASGERIVLDGFNMYFRDLRYSYAEGKLGSAVLNWEKDSFLLDIIESTNTGSFNFDNPQLSFTFKNSYGVPVQVRSIILQAKDRLGNIHPITANLNQGTIINYPLLDQVGADTTTTVKVNPSNSDLANILRIPPTSIEYQLESEILSPMNQEAGFILDTSSLQADMLFELPLRLKARNLNYEAITEIDPNKIMESNEMEVLLDITNGFPVESFIQVYFENADGEILDSLYSEETPYFIEAAKINSSGEVIEGTNFNDRISLDATRVDNLYGATRLRTQANVATVNNGETSVRFFDNDKYRFTIKVGLLTIND